MITVDDVLEACQIRYQLGSQTSIMRLFIFEHQPSNSAVPTLHLYAEVNDLEEPKLERSNRYFTTIASRGHSVICPMCRERFASSKFAIHVKKHKIQKLEITDSLRTKSNAYIQSRIDALAKPVLLPKFQFQKKKKRKKAFIFSAGSPGLGKKN